MGQWDRRLIKRLEVVCTDKARVPGASLPQASGSWAKTKGAYRLLSHPKMKAKSILTAHAQATCERLKGREVILAVQDTTSLNYSTHHWTQGLGPIGNQANRTRGLWLHATMALSPQGQALGIVQSKMWARDPARHGENRQRNHKTLSQKESHRWLEGFAAASKLQKELEHTQVVMVADREGDLYELLAGAQEPGAAGVLVRAQHNRCVEGSDQRLWEVLESQPKAGVGRVMIPRRGTQRAYWGEFEIRFTKLRVQAPCLKKGQEGVNLWAIELRQIHVPSGKRICWKLLSSMPVETMEEALEKAHWYSQRWQIEVYFRTLKSGCRVEQHQMRKEASLQNALAIDMIVAWRVMEMLRAARQNPEARAQSHFSEQELHVLRVVRFSGRTQPLTLREVVREVAKMGGFLARKGDGEPGPKSLWLGLLRFQDVVTGFAAGKLMGNA